MRTIKIEDDVYEYLLRKAVYIGENASEILRRLLDIGTKREMTYTGSQLSECLNDPHFRGQRDVVGKFLYILSHVYKEKRNEFVEKIPKLSGRRRLYFADSKHKLEETGKSVNAKPIPDSPYWVVTNNSTVTKKDILKDVLKRLDYDQAAIDQVVRALS